MHDTTHCRPPEGAQALEFAKVELGRYLALMTQHADCPAESGIEVTLHQHALSENDEIWIDVQAGTGTIRASNARSALIGVYRFLEEAGCSFLRPGPDGERIPARRLDGICVRLHEKASYPYRGVCIEGSNRLENVLNMIDFLPKRGMNAYFLQFKTPHTFFDKWYSHRENPLQTPDGVDVPTVNAYIAQIRSEIKKRDLLYHAVGHGWTTEMLGEIGTGWDAAARALDDSVKPFVAEIDGKRQFHLGVPLDTNLCYSNPKVIDRLAGEVCKFARDNPLVDVIHVWLADNFNNFCECESCRARRPSDHYLLLLNEIDARLTDQGSLVKICFLAYFDLLWPPVAERLKHEERFIFMFAPITRTYQCPFAPQADTAAQSLPFQQNRLRFPTTPEENIAFLREWKQLFSGDCFLYEYHLMWYFFFDLGEFQISSVLAADIENLGSLGFKGFMSCQENRIGAPGGLGLQVLGKKLWNRQVGFDEIAQTYFHDAFGARGAQVMGFMQRLSVLCFPPMFRENAQPDAQTVKGFDEIFALLDSMEPTIRQQLAASTGVDYRMWSALSFVCKLARLMTPMYQAHARGARAAVLAQWEKVKAFAQVMENDMQQEFDLYWFIVAVERALDLRPKFE